jgi:3-hydroxyacyl-CoA dehydrogenase
MTNSNVKQNTKNLQVILSKENAIGLITINYPPVNALSQAVRAGIVEGIELFEADCEVKAIIIRCANRTFIAGADIKEFGKPPTEPLLPDVVNKIEASNKPVIASMFGTSLGGGFEVALACHYRVALKNAKVGLPEVNLGLIPGAGGTQRLPRVIGAERALEMVASGKHSAANTFDSSGLFDRLFENSSDLDKQTLDYVSRLIDSDSLSVNRVGDRTINDDGFDWQSAISKINRKAKGKDAPVVAAHVLYSTKSMSLLEGMAFERKEFLKLRESEQSAALRFAFGAEKMAAKTSLSAEPLHVEQVGIIGAGNMGSGIATAFLSAGFKVQLIEQNQDGLKAGVARIENNFTSNVKRGRMDQVQMDDCLSNLKADTNFLSLKKCDLVLEAVFEDIQVKQDLFAQLDKICGKDCIFATNTSYLDINEIAKHISRPQQLIGMHFFSPANIMKLLEVVQAEQSSQQALVTAMAVGKKLKKISVLVGVCFGFAGNRMYTRYGREIQQMLLEGAKIDQIDHAMTQWGMAMGPLAVQDMSGIDIGHSARSAQPFPPFDPGYFRAAAVMVENGRLGRKTNSGFYDYDANGNSIYSDEAALLVQKTAKNLLIEQKDFTNEEIVQRAILALISEGLALFKEGIVQRLSDIDVVWLHGYGFPRHKGGPMFQAQQMGSNAVSKLLGQFRDEYGIDIWPEVDVSCLTK